MRSLSKAFLVSVVCVVALTASQLAGCRRAQLVSIPFMIPCHEVLSGAFDAWSWSFYHGAWQPESHALWLDDTLVYRETLRAQQPDYTIRPLTAWDGGSRLAVNTILEGLTMEIGSVDPPFRVDRVEPRMDGFRIVLSAPSDADDGLLLGVYSGGPDEGGLLLDRRRGDLSEKVLLDLPGTEWDPATGPEPLFVGPDGEDTVVLVLARKVAPDGGSLPRLVLCRVGSDGRKSWTEVDDRGLSDLTRDVSRHGETSATRLGNRLYVVANHRLAEVDLAAGALRPASKINESLTRLLPELNQEGRVFLTVGAYEAYLIVQCAGGVQGGHLILAFRGDRLAGSVKVTDAGLTPIGGSGESGQTVPWPWPSQGGRGIRLPGLPWL